MNGGGSGEMWRLLYSLMGNSVRRMEGSGWRTGSYSTFRARALCTAGAVNVASSMMASHSVEVRHPRNATIAGRAGAEGNSGGLSTPYGMSTSMNRQFKSPWMARSYDHRHTVLILSDIRCTIFTILTRRAHRKPPLLFERDPLSFVIAHGL